MLLLRFDLGDIGGVVHGVLNHLPQVFLFCEVPFALKEVRLQVEALDLFLGRTHFIINLIITSG